jgi:restriction system protein
MMASENMWMVRAGEGAALVDDYLNHGVVTMGWFAGEDLSSISDRDEVEQRIRARYPDLRDGQVRSGSGQLARFLLDFTIGDRVITYDPRERVYHVGKIVGEYAFRPDLEFVAPDAEHQQTRAVEWIGRVNRDDLSVSARNTLGAIMAIFLMNDDVQAEIEGLLSGKISVASTEQTAELPEELDDVRMSVAESAHEFIKDKLLALKWDEMQDLVAGILRAMGYKTRVSPRGPDRGRDIIASPDGLGLESPRIIVEVTHRQNVQIGAPVMRSFIGGLRAADRGLYVSIGGFAKDAKYEADRAQIPVTLLALDDVAQLLVENYENVDTDTRALVPLVRLYWPAG